ncbi:MAG: RsmB/NOP family class I SAM-dependent RNA methyltransferase [Candidatus Microsaccharimonas sp.]
MANRYESESFHQDDESLDSVGLRTRDIKSQQGRGGYSRKPSDKMSKGFNETALSVFTRRTAQILNITKDEVANVMVTPSQKAVRVNALRFENETPQEQKAVVESGLEQFDIKELPWFDGAYLFNAADTPNVQAHELTQEGKTFIQNPSSFLPVIALEPNRGHEILDMCSAPGGKAALIAAMAKSVEGAEIFANEPKARRAQRMREVFGVLGADSIVSLDQDGRHLPAILGLARFDRILVDAECSTDSGINFESSNPLKDWTVDRVQRMSTLQKQLITSAYDMLQPGGVLVYSTCTLSPEENEEVVASLIGRRKEAIVQPLEFDSEETVRKIKKWNGTQYPTEVSNGVVRIFPTEYMESFCLTRIRKPTGDQTIDVSFAKPVILEEVLTNQ